MDDIVYDDIDDGTHLKAETSNNGTSVNSFGYQNDAIVAQKARTVSRLAWLGVGALFFVVAAFITYSHFIAQPIQEKEYVSDIRNIAMEALTIGDYEKSLEYFQKAYLLDSEDKEFYIYLGTLLIQVGDQTVEGRRRLQEVINSGKGVFQKLAITAVGIADLIDGEYTSADENFMKALTEDSHYAPAKINLGASALQRGEYKEARKWFFSAIEQGTTEGAAYLMLAEANINLFHQTKQRIFLEQGQKQLIRLMQTNYDYYQEAALVLAYMDYISGDMDKVKNKIELILDVDPNLTEDHLHDLFVYRGRISWSVLSNWCIQMVKDLDVDVSVKALHSYCLFKGGKEVEALKWAGDAVTQGARDPLVQAVYAYILDGVGQETRASVALGRANELNRQAKLMLPMILQGRFYTRANKPDLAFKQWQKIYSLDNKSIVSVAGIAQFHFNMKNYSGAQNYLFKGFRLSRFYRPLIHLKKNAEREDIFFKENF